jgi:hypothetical protein
MSKEGRSLLDDDDHFDYRALAKPKKTVTKPLVLTESFKKFSESIKNYLAKESEGHEEAHGGLGRETNGNKLMIVRGSIGSGKITMLQKCLEDLNYSCEIFDQEFEESLGSERCELTRMLLNNSMLDFFCTSKKLCIIIRDFDNSLRAHQQTDLFNFVKKYKNLAPIFLTTNSSKKFPKYIPEITLEKMTEQELVQVAKLHFFIQDGSADPREHKVPISEEILLQNAKSCRGDIRHLIEMLSLGSVRDYDLGIKEKIMFLLENGIKFSEYCSLYTNTVLFNNYIKWTSKNNSKNSKNTKNQKDFRELSLISRSSDILSISDTISNYIYRNNLWDDNSMLSELCILGTIYPLKVVKDKNNENSNKKSKENSSTESSKKSKENSSTESSKKNDDSFLEIDCSEEPSENVEESEDSQGSQDSSELTVSSGKSGQIDPNLFNKLSEFNYALRYIITANDYEEFLRKNKLKYSQIKIVCDGLPKTSVALFKKIYRKIAKEEETE